MGMSPEVTARIAELTGARARLLAPALFSTVVFYVLADELLGYATPGLPYVWAWCAIVVLGLLSIGFILRRIPDRWIHVACFALPWCSTSSTLVTLAHTPSAGIVLLVVIQIASTGILLHTGWLVVTLVAATGAAIPLVLDIPGISAGMAIAALGTAAAFALLVHVVLYRASVRAVTLQLAEAATARMLAQQLAEAESLQAQLVHAQRMEAVGTLAAGVAHDMNNVLGAITNLAELIGQTARSEQREDVAQIITQARRGAELTHGLLAFSRRGQYRKQAITLDRLLGDTLPLLRRMLPRSIEIQEHLSAGDAYVEGDPVHLAQVLTNIALNAADAMGGSGVIEIHVARVIGTAAPQIRIDIKDTGHGMDAATQLRVFEPFFTTKTMGRGSGLGLSVAWGIVQAHDGRIEVRSQPGKGTTFTIFLPITDARPVEEPVRPTPPPPLARKLVLLVDDEKAIRESTRRLLARMGLDVVVAADGAEGLRVFDEHAADIRLVVLDMGMPVMGGAECFAKLRERSNVPVLIATGYADDEQVQELVGTGARIIEKPFAAAELREQVARILDITASVAAAS